VAASDAEAGQEPGLLILVGRALGVGALVIAASAGLFLGIGAFGDDAAGERDPAATDGVAAPDDAGDDPVDATGGDEPDAAAEDPGDGTEGDPDPADAEPDPEPADAEPDPEPDPEPDADEAGDDGDGDGSGEVSDGDAGDAGDGSPAIPPEDISVQVLDGYRGDGGAAADAVAAELSEAGYRIIAQNPALTYEVTTVLWTAGFEDEARQVATEIGATELREQPGNLSESVMVHVVVGADRA